MVEMDLDKLEEIWGLRDGRKVFRVVNGNVREIEYGYLMMFWRGWKWKYRRESEIIEIGSWERYV